MGTGTCNVKYKWIIFDCPEKLEFEQDIAEVITTDLLEAFPQTETDNGMLDLELVDLCVDPYVNPVSLQSWE